MKRMFDNSTYTSFLGFDNLFTALEKFDPTAQQSYPPYNISKLDDNKFLIEIAVAGFKADDLKIKKNKNVLNISGEITEKQDDNKFIHKGIGARKFTRSFTLSDGVQVMSVDLQYGILKIELENILQENIEVLDIGYKRGQIYTDIGGTNLEPSLLLEKNKNLASGVGGGVNANSDKFEWEKWRNDLAKVEGMEYLRIKNESE